MDIEENSDRSSAIPSAAPAVVKGKRKSHRPGKKSSQQHQDASRRKLNSKLLSDPAALTKGRAAMDAKWLNYGLDLPDLSPKVSPAPRAAAVPISLRGVGAAVVATYSRALSLAPQKVATQCSLAQAYRACLLQVTCKLSEQAKSGSPSFMRRPDDVVDVFMTEELTSAIKTYRKSFPLVSNVMSGIGHFQMGTDTYRTYLPDRGEIDPFAVTALNLRDNVVGYNQLVVGEADRYRLCNSIPMEFDDDGFVNPADILPEGWPNRALAIADLEAFDGLLTFLESKYLRASEVSYEPTATCISLVSREAAGPEDCGSVIFVDRSVQFTIPNVTTWHSRTSLDSQTWARGVLSLLGDTPPNPLRSPTLATSVLTADWQDFATSTFQCR